MGRSKCFPTYSCLALAMRDVFANFVAMLTHNAVAKRCVFADWYTWFIYNMLYNRLKLAGSSHNIMTKFMDVQRLTALICVTQYVCCASCMFRKHETLTQCWVDVGPPSTTSAQHQPNIVSTYVVRQDKELDGHERSRWCGDQASQDCSPLSKGGNCLLEKK